MKVGHVEDLDPLATWLPLLGVCGLRLRKQTGGVQWAGRWGLAEARAQVGTDVLAIESCDIGKVEDLSPDSAKRGGLKVGDTGSIGVELVLLTKLNHHIRSQGRCELSSPLRGTESSLTLGAVVGILRGLCDYTDIADDLVDDFLLLGKSELLNWHWKVQRVGVVGRDRIRVGQIVRESDCTGQQPIWLERTR